MFEVFISRVRSAGLAGTGLALVGATLLPLQANAQATKEAPARVDASAAQVVVRDAATGALRAPTAEEAEAMTPRAPAAATLRRGAAPSTMQKAHSSGARGLRLSDDFMSYSVVVRQADGSLVEQCFGSKAEADSALKSAPAAKALNLPTE